MGASPLIVRAEGGRAQIGLKLVVANRCRCRLALFLVKHRHDTLHRAMPSGDRLKTSGVAWSPHRATTNPLLISQFPRTAPDDSLCRGSTFRHTSYGQVLSRLAGFSF